MKRRLSLCCVIFVNLLGCSPIEANPRQEQAARTYFSEAEDLMRRQVDGMLYWESRSLNAETRAADENLNELIQSFRRQIVSLSDNLEMCGDLLLEMNDAKLQMDCAWLDSSTSEAERLKEKIIDFFELTQKKLNLRDRRDRKALCDRKINIILLGSPPNNKFYEAIKVNVVMGQIPLSDEEHALEVKIETERQKREIEDTRKWIDTHPLTDEIFVERGKHYCSNNANWGPLEKELVKSEDFIEEVRIKIDLALKESPTLFWSTRSLSGRIKEFLKTLLVNEPVKAKEWKIDFSRLRQKEARDILEQVGEGLKKMRQENSKVNEE